MQRAAAARMFVRGTQLLVCDDLSSAIDVETERASGNASLRAAKAPVSLSLIVAPFCSVPITLLSSRRAKSRPPERSMNCWRPLKRCSACGKAITNHREMQAAASAAERPG